MSLPSEEELLSEAHAAWSVDMPDAGEYGTGHQEGYEDGYVAGARAQHERDAAELAKLRALVGEFSRAAKRLDDPDDVMAVGELREIALGNSYAEMPPSTTELLHRENKRLAAAMPRLYEPCANCGDGPHFNGERKSPGKPWTWYVECASCNQPLRTSNIQDEREAKDALRRLWNEAQRNGGRL